jgi:hypothetical protein
MLRQGKQHTLLVEFGLQRLMLSPIRSPAQLESNVITLILVPSTAERPAEAHSYVLFTNVANKGLEPVALRVVVFLN